jgi:hypothetical protein
MGGNDAQMKWTARTAIGCARWPDGNPITASAPVAKPQPPANQANTLMQQPQQQTPQQSQQQQPKPQVRVQVQRAAPAAANTRCPEGSVPTADGQCARRVSPLMLPFTLMLPGVGGVDVRVGR